MGRQRGPKPGQAVRICRVKGCPVEGVPRYVPEDEPMGTHYDTEHYVPPEDLAEGETFRLRGVRT